MKELKVSTNELHFFGLLILFDIVFSYKNICLYKNKYGNLNNCWWIRKVVDQTCRNEWEENNFIFYLFLVAIFKVVFEGYF